MRSNWRGKSTTCTWCHWINLIWTMRPSRYFKYLLPQLSTLLILLFIQLCHITNGLMSPEDVSRNNFDKNIVKFIYSEKATQFWKISTLLLSYVVPVKSKVESSQNFVTFSEYMNFTLISWNIFEHSLGHCTLMSKTTTMAFEPS